MLTFLASVILGGSFCLIPPTIQASSKPSRFALVSSCPCDGCECPDCRCVLKPVAKPLATLQRPTAIIQDVPQSTEIYSYPVYRVYQSSSPCANGRCR